jgi:hypothetical protein
MVAVTKEENVSEGEQDRLESIHFKGWILPNPPSLDVKGDSDPKEREDDSDPPVLFSWSQDQESSSPSENCKTKPIQYLEWKKNPKKRRKKKNKIDQDDLSCQSTIVTTEDGTVYIRRPGSKSSRSRRSASKENESPTYNPKFSKSRYKNQQKFNSLTEYYKEKMKTESRQDDNIDDLVAVKMELSELKEWAKKKKDQSKTKRVQFTHPLITQTNYRPRTAPEEIDELFFRDDDLQDWEDDRETTSSERFEVTILGDEVDVIASDCISITDHEF